MMEARTLLIVASVTIFFLCCSHNSVPRQHSAKDADDETLQISIRVPDVISDGRVIPIVVKVRDGIASGDTLRIYVNDKLACSVRPENSLVIHEFSTRVRARKSAPVSATLDRAGDLSRASSYLNIHPGQAITSFYSGNEVKALVRGNVIKVLLPKWAPAGEQFGRIAMVTDQGNIDISLTSQVSQEEFFVGITGRKPFKSASGRVEVHPSGQTLEFDARIAR